MKMPIRGRGVTAGISTVVKNDSVSSEPLRLRGERDHGPEGSGGFTTEVAHW